MYLTVNFSMKEWNQYISITVLEHETLCFHFTVMLGKKVGDMRGFSLTRDATRQKRTLNKHNKHQNAFDENVDIF